MRDDHKSEFILSLCLPFALVRSFIWVNKINSACPQILSRVPLENVFVLLSWVTSRSTFPDVPEYKQPLKANGSFSFPTSYSLTSCPAPLNRNYIFLGFFKMLWAADVNSSASLWDALMSPVPPTSHQSSGRTLHPRIMRSWSVTLSNLMSLEPGGPQVYFVIRSCFSKVCRTYHVMMKILLCLWVRDFGWGRKSENQPANYDRVHIRLHTQIEEKES